MRMRNLSKITPYRLARVLLNIPEEDAVKVKDAIAKNELTSEMAAQIQCTHNFVGIKQPVRGAFGKKGTNRKQQLREKTNYLRGMIEAAKAKGEKEFNENVSKDENAE